MDTHGAHGNSLYQPRCGSPRCALSFIATLLMMLSANVAHATHFRYGHVNWDHVGPASNKTIEFTLQAAWRQDGVSNPGSGGSSDVYRCVDPASFTNQSTKLSTIPCTGPVIGGKANPGVGDVFVENIGTTFFDFGDGAQVGGPGGDPLLFKVTSADPANNWVFALALDTNTLPTVDTTLQHTYSFSGATKNFTAGISDCCRISACTAPNAHMNNPDKNYKVQTLVTVGSGDSSPVSSLPPIVLCPQEGLCQFQVPESDNELDQVTFRLSTATEAGFTSQPGSPQCPHAATIDSNTGVYSWDTHGCRLASSPGPNPPSGGCNNASLNTLYSTQVMLVEPGKNTKTPVDFFIQLVPTCSQNNPPVFDSPPTPACGSTVSANPNQLVSFSIQASDPNGDSVTLNAAGVPQGATLTPLLPATGNPVSATFSWTPASNDVGQHVLTLTATDPCGAQQLCSITVDVSHEICNDGIDNDGDGLVDCFDPDCAGTPCDDGNACTTNDSCSGGPSGCVGGATTSCDDGNPCTDDSCNPASGCVNTNNSAPCTDNNACTVGDTCSGGTCQPGSGTLNCDDHNVCTDDTCDPAGGCQHTNNTAACDDGNACTTGDTCSGGTCIPGTLLNCDDGKTCNGIETCQGGLCQPGTPVDCSGFANQCNDASCVEPTGTCVQTPKINGFSCDDGNVCTMNDTCQNGVCVAGPNGGDADGDGYCDIREMQAQCNPNDPKEIPPQPNVYSGGRLNTPGEILLTFNSPADRDVIPSGNASCATVGTCDVTTRFCTAGKVGDPCLLDNECNQPPNTCRVVINYAATPDLQLLQALLKVPHQTGQSLLPIFQPVTPGCSRKVDITLPAGFGRASLRLKAQGTTSGRKKKDRDRIKYFE